MTHIERLWKTQGRKAAVVAYYEGMSLSKSMARAAEAVDRMANKREWGEAKSTERFARV